VERVALEDILYEFAGVTPVLTLAQLGALLGKVGLPPDAISVTVERLRTLSFLGVEVPPGTFRYAEDNPDFCVVRARRLLRRAAWGETRFEVPAAFRAFLEISAGPGVA